MTKDIATPHKDLMAAFFACYNFDYIACWANSLDRCGFTGDTLIVCSQTSPETVAKLRERGYLVHEVETVNETKGALNVERRALLCNVFATLPNFNDYRYVIVTDMRDLVFQSDPSNWLTKHAGDWPIIASKEGILVGDRGWNAEVILNNFGEAALQTVANRPVCNGGVIAAKPNIIIELFTDLVAFAGKGKIDMRDQATLNLILQDKYLTQTLFVPQSDGWACQIAINMRERFRPRYDLTVEGKPPIFEDDFVRTPTGEIYTMVHQYDREPVWDERINQLYGMNSQLVKQTKVAF